MKKVLRIFLKFVFIVLSVLLLVAVFQRKNIFPADSVFYNLYEENVATILMVKIIKLLVVFAGAFLVIQVAKLIKKVGSKSKEGTTKTISTLVSSVMKIASWIYIIFQLMSMLGVDVTTIVASMGVLAMVIGLGCETLIKDIVSGIFILTEGDYKVDDVVVYKGWRGQVVEIGLRTTKIMDVVGNLSVINNSEITTITNNSKNNSGAYCEIQIPAKFAVEEIEKFVMDNLPTIRESVPAIKDGPFYDRIGKMNAKFYTLCLSAKCNENDKYQVERDILSTCKSLFDQYGLYK